MTPRAGILGLAWLAFCLWSSGCKDESPEIEVMKWGPIPGMPIEEYNVTVSARPEIQVEKDYSLLRLPAVKGRPIEVICGAEFSPWFSDLPKDKSLTFVVWQTKQVSMHSAGGKEEFTWQSEIESIKDGEATIYDATICPLHKVRMLRIDVEISYGLPAGELLEAFKNFSGGPGFTLGGCVVMEGSPKKERGYRCAQCATAYAEWSKTWKAEMEERIRSQKTEAQAKEAKL